MPLTKRQFELGITDEVENWMRAVYNLLGGHKELAYSQQEIIDSLLGEEPISGDSYLEYSRGSRNIEHSLGVLAGIGAVERRKVGYQEYYVFQQELDTDSWNRKSSI